MHVSRSASYREAKTRLFAFLVLHTEVKVFTTSLLARLYSCVSARYKHGTALQAWRKKAEQQKAQGAGSFLRGGKTITSKKRLLNPLSRLILFSCFLFSLVACSQTAPEPTGPPSSPQGNSSPQGGIQALQRRALHLPTIKPGTSCPTSPEQRVTASFGIAQGDGPAYATPGTTMIESPAIFRYLDAQHFHMGDLRNQGWGGQKVLWFVNPRYQGSVLVRGHQLDGPHGIRFGLELDQQLVLDTQSGGTPWPNFPSFTRLQAPGCYAYQVDGNTFSYLIIFQAVQVSA